MPRLHPCPPPCGTVLPPRRHYALPSCARYEPVPVSLIDGAITRQVHSPTINMLRYGPDARRFAALPRRPPGARTSCCSNEPASSDTKYRIDVHVLCFPCSQLLCAIARATAGARLLLWGRAYSACACKRHRVSEPFCCCRCCGCRLRIVQARMASGRPSITSSGAKALKVLNVGQGAVRVLNMPTSMSGYLTKCGHVRKVGACVQRPAVLRGAVG